MNVSINNLEHNKEVTISSVSICQAGYNSNGIKTAVAVVKGCPLADESFQLIRASDNEIVFSGIMIPFEPDGWTRGETYYKIDFSAYNADGNYVLRTNNAESYKFRIKENIWADYTSEMIGYYRIQRCGVDTWEALPEEGFPNRPSPEALHGPCHMDDALVGSPSGRHADCTGGWHDAGDNNKYNSQFGWLAAAMVSTYFRYPAAFDHDNNGIPDLLDEARVAAEYLLKVQKASDNNGGILDQVQNHKNAYVWLHPADETDGIPETADDRVLERRPSTIGKFPSAYPYDTAMKAAAGLAAVARAYHTIDLDFAEKCKAGAVKAYDWALMNTANTGGSYCTVVQENSTLLAAVELYLLTKEQIYSQFVDNYIDTHSDISLRGTNYWGAEPLALADYYPVAGQRQEKIVKLLENAVDQWISSLVEPFGVSADIATCNFGINEPNLSKAADAYRLYTLTGNTKVRDAAIKAMEWTLGVNPFDMSFVIGIGSRFPAYPHTRFVRGAETNPESAIYLPGFLVCGPIARDTLNPESECPWYEDRPLCEDGLQQWRYNEHSVSIQYACLDLVIALAYGNKK